MKKFIAFILFLAVAVIVVPWLHPAKADQVNVYQDNQLVKSVVFKIGVSEYVVNGQTPGVKMDVAPFIQNDRTFVPVRFLGNALGVNNSNITWDNATQTATLKGAKATLNMTIGKAEVVSNGVTKAIDVSPMLVDPGRTMLPARFVAEGLGYQVDWDEATQTVICWPAGQTKPDVRAAVNYLVSKVTQSNPQGKPDIIVALDNLLGVSGHKSGSEWAYSLSNEEKNSNRDKSSFSYCANSNNGKILIGVDWAQILPDIRNVQLDLSPIEKVLNWRFPDQPAQVQEIMDYAWQVAEKTRSSDGLERLPLKYFNVGGHEVAVHSMGLSFVIVNISN
ncbi:MAG: hypothetical protein A4E52_00072 [Pelotomaculum sp. PtaB.Bin013]|nr:MAG: hypothetical protein A4E52_00072 [Pelotomaculum sp. PtaB.Bin013]